ncbi:hypothetical protein EGW08_012886, partial [Elysia chlorotica]
LESCPHEISTKKGVCTAVKTASNHSDTSLDTNPHLRPFDDLPDDAIVRRAVSRNGASVLDKKQYCYFCHKPQLKLARHLTTIHKDARAVARLLAVKQSKHEEYLIGLKKLKCIGNFIHNVESIKLNKPDIVVKRPTKSRSVAEYLPCVHCYGFYVREELWKHTKNCEINNSNDEKDLLDTLCIFCKTLRSFLYVF